MKKRNLSFITAIAMFVIIALLTACGGKSTSAQEPADQQKPTQEAAESSDQQKPTQEAQETTEPADQQEKPVTNQEVATSDVKHWKVEDGKLMGQTGAEEFVCFASFLASSA